MVLINFISSETIDILPAEHDGNEPMRALLSKL